MKSGEDWNVLDFTTTS